MPATIQQSGKIAFSLKQDERQIILLAVRQAVYFDAGEMPPALYWLLIESLSELEKENKHISLRKSEFFAVFSEVVMQYVDIPTQLILKQAVSLSQFTNKLNPTT